MQFVDRHGTEIREGDTVETDDGRQIVVAALMSGRKGGEEPWCVQLIGRGHPCGRCVVLSRADGTPVYRYKGGEDARLGDVFEYFGDKVTLAGFTGEHGSTTLGCADPGTYYNPSACTLIRRAETQPSSTALIAQRPELAAKPGKTLAEIAREIRDMRFPILDDRKPGHADARPILGKDRNGRDVRVGDIILAIDNSKVTPTRVQSVRENIYHPGAWLFEGEETGRSGFFATIPDACAELVADDKTEPTITFELLPGECAESSGHRVIDALESFLRALNTPTKPDTLHVRRAEFVDIIGRVLAEGAPRATFVHDFGWMTVKKHGEWTRDPVLVAWLRFGTEEETIAFLGNEDAEEFEAFVWKTVATVLARVGHEVMK